MTTLDKPAVTPLIVERLPLPKPRIKIVAVGKDWRLYICFSSRGRLGPTPFLAWLKWKFNQ